LTPDVCADGYEAAELAGAQSCDLVIVDVQMACMDGLEAAHRIRALQRTEEAARIIAFTANTTEEMRDACKAVLPPGSRRASDQRRCIFLQHFV
jgi:CheY-like chemotaxis protein